MIKEHRAGFSERNFEFAFNMEYARKHHAVLAGLPWIPTQQQEKLLAYDVRFRLKGVSGVKSLFLQHKVSMKSLLTPIGSTSRSKFVAALGERFYKFRIDNDQYNKIVKLRQKNVAVFYCAPFFVGARTLNRHFMKGILEPNSVWIDVRPCPLITGSSLKSVHHLAYNDALLAYRFSETAEAVASVAGTTGRDVTESVPFNQESLRAILDSLYVACEDNDRRSLLRRTQPGPGADMTHLLARVASFAAQEFGLSWLLEPTGGMVA